MTEEEREPEQVIGFIGHPDAGITSTVRLVKELAPTPVKPLIVDPIEIDWGYEEVVDML